MKKLPITLYITLWYAAFLIVVLLILVGVITYMSNNGANEQAENRITDQISELSDDIKFSQEEFTLNEDLKYVIKGVYLSVYDERGEMIEGKRPVLVGNYPDLANDTLMREKDETGEYWYIYDMQFILHGEKIWIRGIAQDQTNIGTGAGMFLKLRWVLVALAAIAIIGGIIIAVNALRPIRKIIRTVDDIRDDGDLSRRISPGRRKDEISELADSFNGMFESLEKTMQNEKQFTSDVSHELRTPLSVIVSSSDYALSDESYREEALETINKEAKRMSTLVSRLLTLSRSDAGRLQLKYERVDLSEMCRMIADQQRFLVEENDENRSVKILDDIENGVNAQCDEELVMRAVLNLMDNAVHYGTADTGDVKGGEPESGDTAKPDDATAKATDTTAKPGGTQTKPVGTIVKPADATAKATGTLAKPAGTQTKPVGTIVKSADTSAKAIADEAVITLRLKKNGNMALISVEDNGPGISPENMEKVWDRFYRGDSSRSERGSSGLGLSMVKAIARNHGGDVSLSSTLGKGSTFTVIIPLERRLRLWQ